MDVESRLSNVGATSIFALANWCATTTGHLSITFMSVDPPVFRSPTLVLTLDLGKIIPKY
jgi:hypothetical protein